MLSNALKILGQHPWVVMRLEILLPPQLSKLVRKVHNYFPCRRIGTERVLGPVVAQVQTLLVLT